MLGARALLEAKTRRQSGRFLAEGPQAVASALAAGLVESVYSLDLDSEVVAAARAAGARCYLIDRKALATLTDTVTPQGPIAIARIPEADFEQSLRQGGVWLVCDRVSDPGNLGTMIRTAAAAGASGVVTTAGSADAWSGKVIRSTAGTFANLPIISGLATPVVLAAFAQASIPLLVAAGSGTEDFRAAAARQPGAVAWVVGSEAHGVGADFLASASAVVRIPMADAVESLNAAVAAALCLYASVPNETQARF